MQKLAIEFYFECGQREIEGMDRFKFMNNKADVLYFVKELTSSYLAFHDREERLRGIVESLESSF